MHPQHDLRQFDIRIYARHHIPAIERLDEAEAGRGP
jgi:hypothetical protein